ncbi:MAG: radical SAM protein [Corynebacterium sp.]|nr:radical SAM protein [Corynebacterium sp.]
MTRIPEDRHGLYIHVPFCSTRCGYCDFNTYTPGETGSSSMSTYLSALEAELDLAACDWDRTGPPSTVVLGAVKRTLGLAPGAEVTTESNPESTSPEFFDTLLEAGYTRVSLGMQSAAGHVLKVLDRTHTPGRATEAAREAMAAGFEHVNLDLIYGTPTETDDDLRLTLDQVLSTGVDHVSAYSLIVEDGTAMARKVRKGLLPQPDEDVYADRYEMIDSALSEAGMGWYEVSNWSRPGGECRHNMVYWRSGQWWGAGPGAHGCVRLVDDPVTGRGVEPVAADASGTSGTEFSGITRLVNAKLPRRYAEALGEGTDGADGTDGASERRSPVTTVEPLSRGDLHTERVMLGLRLREGLADEVLASAASAVEHHVELGLLERVDGRTRLTDRGRLLADGIITDILLAEEG